MSTYVVEITETRKYNIEVEAEDEDQAEKIAFDSEAFVLDLCNSTDAEVTSIKLVEE